ncbi:MAG: ATP-binding protein, partial [Beijerinckiaceae bacterium]
GPGLGPAAVDLLNGKTTRPVSSGEGAGLGLWMSQRLAKELQGRVAAGRSKLGGAAITVRFPLPQERSFSHAA